MGAGILILFAIAIAVVRFVWFLFVELFYLLVRVIGWVGKWVIVIPAMVAWSYARDWWKARATDA